MKRRWYLFIALILALVVPLAAGAYPAETACPSQQATRNNGNHSWTYKYSTEADCTNPATDVYECVYCKQTTAEVTAGALGHAWDAGTVTTAPTCTAAGVKTYTCTRCKATSTESIPAAGHTPVAIPAVAATCTAGGKTEGSKCSVCGTILTAQSDTAALGHSWDSGTVTTAPTCTAAGVKTYTCTRCGVTSTESIPAAGHTPAAIPAVAATCTAGGKTEGSKCSVCGTILTAQTDTAALGHSWDGGKITTAGTCMHDGVKTYTCTRCGNTYPETIKALGHKWDDGTVTTEPTCEMPGVRTHICQNDKSHTWKEEIPAVGHQWDEGVVTAEPGYLTPGEKTYTCMLCGERRTEEIEPTAWGSGMANLVRNQSDISLFKPDLPLIITHHPVGGKIERDGPGLLLTVEADGGTPPYTYEWRYKTPVFTSDVQTAAEMKTAGGLSAVLESIWNGQAAAYSGTKSELSHKLSGLSEVALFNGSADFNTIYNGAEPTAWNDYEVTGATEPGCMAYESGFYYCIVRDKNGDHRTSEEAEVSWKLRILFDPEDYNVCDMDEAVFCVEADGGKEPYTYQWYEVTDDGASEHETLLEGETKDELHVPVDSSTEKALYYCIVTDAEDDTATTRKASMFSMRVDGPYDLVFLTGEESGELSVTVTGGKEPYAYQWVEVNNYSDLWVEIKDGTGPALPVSASDAYRYYLVQVTDADGHITYSATASVTMAPLKIVEQPVGGKLPKEGGTHTLSAAIEEGKAPFYSWLYRDGSVWDYAESDELTVSYTVECGGNYYIKFEDGDQRLARTEQVSVEEYKALRIVDYTREAVVEKPGDYATLTVQAEGGKEPYRYRWLFHTGIWGDEYKDLQYWHGKYNHDTPQIDVWPHSHTEGFIIEVTDADGDSVYSDTIPVRCNSNAPWITQQPGHEVIRPERHSDSTSLYYQYSGSIECKAVSYNKVTDDDLEYEWQIKTESGWVKYKPSQKLNGGSKAFFAYHEWKADYIMRCVVTDKTNGEQTVSDEGGFRIPLESPQMFYTGNGKGATWEFTGVEPPYTITVTRTRDADLNYSTISNDDRKTTVTETWNPGKKMKVTEDGYDVRIRLENLDQYGTDCYKQSGFYWYYRKHAWKYKVTIKDAAGREVTGESYYGQLDAPVEYKLFLNII